ncbi:Putative membrane protein [Amycolatopsis japonica]|uniref:Putative membrane protein n=1 Tax=Amycolatopsis japonica TaxID=208439 RepID=A0A075UZG8_9PSEU|nr:Putative membrane protein [Amycolatopsis japonica]
MAFVRKRSDPARGLTPGWNSLAVAAGVGLLVVFLAWFAGPGLFGISNETKGTTVQAEVVQPAPCTGGATERVKFEFGGAPMEGSLNGCGHGQGERIEVVVPDGAAGDAVSVHAADATAGASDARRPLGLALLVFSCFAGGMYVFLVLRGPRVPVTA